MALTDAGPAPGPSPARPTGPRGRLWAMGIVIGAALAFLLFQGLSTATVYFKTADEAVAEKAALGDRRFRLEGMVVDAEIEQQRQGADFTVRGDRGAVVQVVHDGTVPELFEPGIPVVMEGHWDGDRYRSDRILVKHTSEYRAENPDRVTDYTKP